MPATYLLHPQAFNETMMTVLAPFMHPKDDNDDKDNNTATWSGRHRA
jgi:hypothetical protein